MAVSDDGCVSLEWVSQVHERPNNPEKPIVFVPWLTGAIANMLLAIERVRLAASVPSAEFALEFMYVSTGAFVIGDYNHSWHVTANAAPEGEVVFPRYAVGSRDQFDNIARLFERDVVNLSGADHPGHEPEYDFSIALAAIDQNFAVG
jgi:hypothetical protein